MILNKKGLSMIMIIGIIISIITLVILFFLINSQFDSYQYSQSLIACNLLFSNIDGKPTYFGSGLDKINSKLIDEIAKQCSSKKVIVDEKSINVAADLILDCYEKTASGEDIFGVEVKNQKICLYCGEIEAKSDINDFKLKLDAELNKTKYYSKIYSKESEIENLNHFNLQYLPLKLEKGESTTVFYYIYRSDIPKNLDVTTWIRDEYISTFSKLVGENTGQIGSMLNFYISENVLKTYGGIILTRKFDNKNTEDFKEFTNSINSDDCTLIVPLKEFK